MNEPRCTNPEIALETMYHWAGDRRHFVCMLTNRDFDLPAGAPALIIRFADASLKPGIQGISAKPGHEGLVIHPDFAVKGIEAIRDALKEYLRQEHEEVREAIDEERRKFELRMADLEDDAQRVRDLEALLDQEWSAAPCCTEAVELGASSTHGPIGTDGHEVLSKNMT